jgi:hypothetical protein
MRARKLLVAVVLVAGVGGPAGLALAQHKHDASHEAAQAAVAKKPAADPRIAVRFPAGLREHTLTNMRDHLLALAEIHEALSKGAYDVAGKTAEERLGMSSLKLHGAHEVSKYMPKGMQEIGTSMHHSASQFAVEAQNSSATGDLKPALAVLARITQACVACHATYRLQ